MVVPVAQLEDKFQAFSTVQKAQRLLRNGKVEPGMLKALQGMPLDQFDQFDALIASRYELQMLKAGVVWTDAELRSQLKLNDGQMVLYKKFRMTTDRSHRHDGEGRHAALRWRGYARPAADGDGRTDRARRGDPAARRRAQRSGSQPDAQCVADRNCERHVSTGPTR